MTRSYISVGQMQMFRLGSAVLVALLAWHIIHGQGSSVEARVTAVSGTALVSGNGRRAVNVTEGIPLAPGDEIDTRSGGRVVIDLTDGSQVIVLPGSYVVLGSYQNAASLKELLQITLGRIRVRINHFKGKPNPYRIKSPTASIAVRGTEFEVNVAALGETEVKVIDGAVDVASLRYPKRMLVAEPGRKVVVHQNFTIDILIDPITREIGEHNKKNPNHDPVSKGISTDDPQSARTIYERSVERIIESGEATLPSRFTAFADPYSDTFENPAYAESFRTPEARFDFVPSLNGSRSPNEDVLGRLGLNSPRPVSYSVIPRGSVFLPISRPRLVVGGGFGYLRTASQSLVATELTPLRSPPFPPGTEGLRVTNGSTTGNLYTAAVLLAKRFGKHDKSSLGVSVERIFSANGLTESIAETSGALSWDQQLSSRSLVHRSRITVGIKHDFHGVKFGAFYRYGVGSGKEFDRSRLVNGVAQPNDITKSRGTTSELGFRIRGFFSPRFYYGAEASFFLGQTRESIRRSVITDSTQRDHTFRSTLGFGLGYVVSPRTILSFDIAGGMVDLRQTRIEDLTHHTLETEKARGRFLSLHAAIQIDVWRNAFLSASILSIMQSHNSFMTFFPDRFGRTLNAEGVPSVGGSSKDLFTDIYSNYGAGWRLRPNVIFQYILSTDYGQTDIRHTFLLRYTIGGKK